ncbi:hypothetical protein A8O16_23910 [Sphingobium sp. 20006FA]|nr:hypothetical protein A8O16_23910 [Sphingobium sp. 20006FA]
MARLADPPVRRGPLPDHQVRILIDFAEAAESDPFLALADDRLGASAFGPHPHRGMETVTYVIAGQVDHRSSMGSSGVIGPGDVQWMTAGRGVVHDERTAEDRPNRILQLWVNLPAHAKMAPPRYQTLLAGDMPHRQWPGGEYRLFSGALDGLTAPTLNHVPVLMVDLRLDAEGEARIDIPSGHNGFLVVLEGTVLAGRDRTMLSEDMIGWMTGEEESSGSHIPLAAMDGPTHILLFAGRPIGEPIVARGPFVMNSEEEIVRAYADYRAGRFTEL